MAVTKNKYVELVEEVLSKKKSHLTASEIWDTGVKEGYFSDVEYGNFPVKSIIASLNLYIRRNYRADIQSSGDIPRKYYLKSSLITVNNELIHQEADVILIGLRGLEKSQKIKILNERIEQTRNKKIVFNKIIVDKPIRNSNVIAFVRLRTEFSCELCGWIGFMKENGEQYIEVHHLMMISEGGADIPGNAVALCPNCHRKMHHAENREGLMKEVIEKLAAKGISVSPILCIPQKAEL